MIVILISKYLIILEKTIKNIQAIKQPKFEEILKLFIKVIFLVHLVIKSIGYTVISVKYLEKCKQRNKRHTIYLVINLEIFTTI